ncbi:MAG: substrate-binding domain-containing protein, partial [Paracoccaceae bacterium]
ASISGHITIAMTSHVVSPHFDRVLREFNAIHPDATYSISISESAEVLNRLRANRTTLGVCLMRESDPALDASVLFREFFAFYCGPAHRLFGKPNIKLSELQGESSVSFQTEADAGPLHSVNLLRERALLRPEIKGISANLPEVRRMIVAGIGIGALPIHVAQRDVDLGNLWRLPPYGNPPAVDVFFVTSRVRSFNPAEMALISAVRNMIATEPLGARTYQGQD